MLHLVSYIHYTRDLTMQALCSRDAPPEPRICADAGFAACWFTARSASDIVVHIGTGSCAFPVMWRSRKQTSTARFTPEAEMIAMASAMFSDVINLQTFLETALRQYLLSILNSGYRVKLRHLGRIHRVNVAGMSEILYQEDYSAQYINGKDQLANGSIKGIPPAEHPAMLAQLCLTLRCGKQSSPTQNTARNHCPRQ